MKIGESLTQPQPVRLPGPVGPGRPEEGRVPRGAEGREAIKERIAHAVADGRLPEQAAERLQQAITRFREIEKDLSSGERREFHHRVLEHLRDTGGGESSGAQGPRLPVLDALV